MPVSVGPAGRSYAIVSNSFTNASSGSVISPADGNAAHADISTAVNTALTFAPIDGQRRVMGIQAYTATPPGSPAEGQVWLVATGGTGVWSGKDKKYAAYLSGAFVFFDPVAGDSAIVVATRQSFIYDSTGAWQQGYMSPDGLKVWPASVFGITAATADIGAALNSASAIVAATGGGVIQMDAVEYLQTTRIDLGNGSASANSTINNVVIRGVGGQFFRLRDGTTSLKNEGTRFKWVGATTTLMARVNGPCVGNCFQHIGFNGNNIADDGLECISASRADFPSLALASFLMNGVHLTTVSAEAIGGVTEALSTEGLNFPDIRIDGASAGTAATCIKVTGYTGSAANGWDPVRCTFHRPCLIVNRAGGTGIEMEFTDQVTFHDTFMIGSGTPDGTQSSIKFVGINTVPSAYPFPQNIVFSGQTDIGQELPVRHTGLPMYGGHRIENLTTFDSQAIPEYPVTKYVSGTLTDAGIMPYGGFRSEFGLGVRDRAFRNKLLNSTFRRQSRGASRTNAPAGGRLADGWLASFDTSGQFDWAATAFTPGQTDVLFNPTYYMRLTRASGAGTFFLFGQRIRGAYHLDGQLVTLSAWIKAPVGTPTVGLRIERVFGSGGSATVATTSSAIAVTSSWALYQWTVRLDAIAGQTYGANNYIGVYLSLPTSAAAWTLDVALPQFEGGPAATAFDMRPPEVDELLLQKELRRVSTGAAAGASSGTQAAIGSTFQPAMSATPTIESFGTAVSINIPGDATYTAASPTFGLLASSQYGVTLSVSGFTGMTAFRAGFATTDVCLLTCEL